jgi:hypothetical protein
MQISGLPYASANSGNITPVVVYPDALALTAGNIAIAAVLNNSTIITLQQTPVGGGLGTPVPMDAVFNMYISFTYFAA